MTLKIPNPSSDVRLVSADIHEKQFIISKDSTECGRVVRSEMGGADRHLLSTASIKRPTGTCCVLLLMMSALLATHIAGSTLCDRCETEEVRALRRYYLSLNLASVLNDTHSRQNVEIRHSTVCQNACLS